MSLLAIAVRPSPIAILRLSDESHPERRVRRGDLVRIRAGVYAPAQDWHALAPWDRYLARVHAVALIRPDAIFSHESAAVLLGMPIFGDPVTVHVLAPPGTTARLVAGVRVHTWSSDRKIIETGGRLVTDVAETAVDLARFRHAAIGVATADAALRMHSKLTTETLAALNEGRASKRGRARARWPLSFGTALAESAGESTSRVVIHWLGFPPPVLQLPFPSPSGEDRPDFTWLHIGLAGESDGDLKYDGRYGHPSVVLRRQSERDARLREQQQLTAVAHWGWREVTTVDPLRSLLLGHGLRPEAPENSVELFSLRRAVSPTPPHRVAPSAPSRETSLDRRDRG